MKGTLALLLIAAGLYIVYEVISGGTTPSGVHPNNPQYPFQLAPQKSAEQVGIANMGTRATGGAIPPANVPFIPPPKGGGMVSMQSRIRRLFE